MAQMGSGPSIITRPESQAQGPKGCGSNGGFGTARVAWGRDRSRNVSAAQAYDVMAGSAGEWLPFRGSGGIHLARAARAARIWRLTRKG